MEKEQFVLNVDTVVIGHNKYISVKDLVLFLHSVRDEGFNTIFISDLIAGLKGIKGVDRE